MGYVCWGMESVHPLENNYIFYCLTSSPPLPPPPSSSPSPPIPLPWTTHKGVALLLFLLLFLHFFHLFLIFDLFSFFFSLGNYSMTSRYSVDPVNSTVAFSGWASSSGIEGSLVVTLRSAVQISEKVERSSGSCCQHRSISW